MSKEAMIEVELGVAASYAAAGVNLDAGDAISAEWFNAARGTYDVREGRLGQMAFRAEDFAGLRGVDLDLIQGQPGLVLSTGVDGVGTKTELAERATASRKNPRIVQVVGDEHLSMLSHGGISQDVIAMTADDISRDGGEPIGVNFLYDIRTSEHEDALEVSKQLAEGAREACIANELVLLNGETAELGDRIGGHPGSFNYNLGGFVVGATHRERILDGSKVRPGQAIVALQEHGFRANGMSLVRKVLTAKLGDNWHLENPLLVADALRPSQVYTNLFVDLHGGYDLRRKPKAEVSAIVHVTGGGIPGKLQRKLAATGRGAMLEDLFSPPDVMRKVQRWSLGLDDERLHTKDASLYQTLNGGVGALVITSDPDKVIDTAAVWGVRGKYAGEVLPEPGIIIKSRGMTDFGKLIRYNPKS